MIATLKSQTISNASPTNVKMLMVKRVAGDEDPAERVGEVPDAGEGHESSKEPREVDGPEQQAAEADEMQAEDRERHVPAIAERGDGGRDLRVELVRLQAVAPKPRSRAGRHPAG